MSLAAWYADWCRRTGFNGMPRLRQRLVPSNCCHACRRRRISQGASPGAVRARKLKLCSLCYRNGDR